MRKTILFLFCGLMFSANLNAQTTWNIGSPVLSTVTATFHNDTLTITGTGDMRNWAGENIPPWYIVRTLIKVVIISDGITSIGSAAFYNCTQLTTVNIGSDVTAIENLAFYNCSRLASITIPNSVVTIGVYAFQNCTVLKNLVIDGGENTLYLDPPSSFAGCSVDTVYMGRNVQTGSINSGPLFGTGVKHLTMVNNRVTSIPRHAFQGNIGLTEITIPNSVTFIGESAFQGCSNLTTIISHSSIPTFIWWNTFLGVTDSCCLYVPEVSIDNYRSSNGWGNILCIKPLWTNDPMLLDSILALRNHIATLQDDTAKLRDSIAKLWKMLDDCENSGTPNAIIIPQSHIQIFPNPTNYELRIINYDFQQGDMVELFDMNGRRVYSTRANGNTTIDMSAFQSGNYILRIGNRVAKIVKQ